MAEQPGINRRDLEMQLITKAWKDDAFAQELKSNPQAVLERELGGKLPEGVEVKVVEESQNTIYLVIPEKPKAAQGELSDEQLAAAAGGTAECIGYSWRRVYSIAPCGPGTGTIHVW